MKQIIFNIVILIITKTYNDTHYEHYNHYEHVPTDWSYAAGADADPILQWGQLFFQ